ncbi:MAG: SET domain-containing protein-lysine N-methyltransferase [Acidimicrobiales bacterium]|nr:SET domain-containing protein-lysine N-methyltransferase [Acidimicrobiales bacterium]
MNPTYVQGFALSIGEAADGYVVTDLAGGEHHLTATALFILERCAEPCSAAEITGEVQSAFDLPEVPEELVEACVAELVEAGLVVDADEVEWPPPPQPEQEHLAVRVTVGAGRGVFARRRFDAGEVIERCPMIVIEADEADAIQHTVLGRYVFDWREGRSGLALGFGSLYNHSPRNNAEYQAHDRELILEIVALRPIEAGEEILIDYTGGGVTELAFTPTPT